MTRPEDAARKTIDDALTAAGWAVQDRQAMNLDAARGVAVREFPLKRGHGFADYLYVLRSQHGRSEIERLATGNQESMRNIGQDRIRRIRLLLPPLQEQQRIIAEVERVLSVADETEQAVRFQLRRAQRLRQSVLKRAFEGKLVPQDPNDEPASALLDRLRAARAEAPAANGSGRTSRRARAKVLQADKGGLDDG